MANSPTIKIKITPGSGTSIGGSTGGSSPVGHSGSTAGSHTGGSPVGGVPPGGVVPGGMNVGGINIGGILGGSTTGLDGGNGGADGVVPIMTGGNPLFGTPAPASSLSGFARRAPCGKPGV